MALNRNLFTIFVFTLLYLYKILNGYSINNDGILYLDIADQISKGNASYVRENFYGNLAYPYLIYYVSSFISISYLSSALLINYIFIIVFLYYLLKLNNDFFQKNNIFFLLILFSFYPYTQKIVFQIIRDHGYFTFLMVSIYFYFRFKFSEPSCSSTLLISIFSSLIASFFRIEGIIFFGIFILFYLISGYKKKNNLFLILSFIFLLLIFSLMFLFYGKFNLLGRLNDFIYFFDKLSETLIDKPHLLSNTFLYTHFNDFAFLISIFLLFIYLIYEVIYLCIPFFLIYLFTSDKKFFLNQRNKYLYFISIVGFFIAYINLIIHGFVSNRYLVFYCLILIPIFSNALFNEFNKNRNLYFYTLFFILIIFFIYGSLRFINKSLQNDITNSQVAINYIIASKIYKPKLKIIDKKAQYYFNDYSLDTLYEYRCRDFSDYNYVLLNQSQLLNFDFQYNKNCGSYETLKIFDHDKGRPVYLIRLN